MSARPDPARAGPARPVAVLLRGVNVGGSHRLPMAAWRACLAAQGFGDPQTLIQSGNAVIAASGPPAAIAEKVTDGIAATFGFRPLALVLTVQDLDAALDHPFPQDDPTRLHATFLATPGAAFDAERAEALRAPSESLLLRPGHLLLHAPQGIGRSRLAAALPRLFACPVTTRNLRTVAALRDMLRSREGDGGAG